ncbi:recombinase family protein [Streptomyces lunalinharesii]|uniref:Resolvase/invertase-type recombinase catalytic domain-containing protein n=1 Tax=Streptomyces lunalinharesii TaxID=333384 RepID=A0ABN3SLU1_9ACTN
MTVYGYVCSGSLHVDDLDRALFTSGCSQVFDDLVVSTLARAPGWRKLVGTVRAGDTVRVADWNNLSRDVETAEFITSTLTHLGVHVETL